MSKSKVVIIECHSYDKDEVFNAVKKGMSLLGGFSAFVNPDEKILLKPNLLVKSDPNRACTTHPAVFEAVGRLLQEEGYAKLSYGDSSGNHLAGLAKIAEGCGLKAPADALGIQPGDFGRGIPTPYPAGKVETEFILCPGILDADAIISLSKMKTHALERLTGAVKNTFGAIYGFNKGAFHAKFTDPHSFARMLIDLNMMIKPRLHIMDAVVAMEGNGPQSGTPVNMNLLLFSTDPVALDTVFARLVNIDPLMVPTTLYGGEFGLGCNNDDEIEVVTESGNVTVAEAAVTFGKPDFDVNRNPENTYGFRSLSFLAPFMQKRPIIDKRKCVKCGICSNSCPLTPKALIFDDKKNPPVYDYKRCIRCYCCQEMCPEKAIDVKTPALARFLDKNWKL